MKEREKDEAKRKAEAQKLDADLGELMEEIDRLNSGPRADLDQARAQMRDAAKYVDRLDREGHNFARREDADQLFNILRDALRVANLLVAFEGRTLEHYQWEWVAKAADDLAATAASMERARRELDQSI